jgi:hypothetical protein
MTETAPEYREDDQILALVDRLRADVLPVLAPRLAEQVDALCRLVVRYRLQERKRQAISRMANNGEAVER